MIENEYIHEDSGSYRMKGEHHVVEHYMIKTAEFGEVDAAMLPELRRRKAEREAAMQNSSQPAPTNTGRACPFKTMKNDYHAECKTTCAFYNAGCIFAGTSAERDTQGMECAICGRCKTDCAMYNSGCTLTGIFKGINARKG